MALSSLRSPRVTETTVDITKAGLGILTLLLLAFGRGWSHDRQVQTGKVPLRVAYFPNLTHAPALVGIATGKLQTGLPEYSISTRVVNAGPEAMEALLAGEVDVAFVGPSPAINTYLKSNGKALRIISGACEGGAALVARPEANIHSVGDLSGKTVAVPQLGGTQDVSCRHFIALAGLKSADHGGTVSILPLKNPDILTLFKQKQLDAAWVPEPWASRLCAEAGAHVVVDESQLWPSGHFITTVVVVRTAFAAIHPLFTNQFVASNEAVLDWMHKNGPAAEKLVNQELKRLSGKGLSASLLHQAWSKLSFSSNPNVESVRSFERAAYEEGYLKTDPGTLPGIFAPNAEVALGQRKNGLGDKGFAR
jgi:NitT/TauT family transport system substrate-binding protein